MRNKREEPVVRGTRAVLGVDGVEDDVVGVRVRVADPVGRSDGRVDVLALAGVLLCKVRREGEEEPVLPV